MITMADHPAILLINGPLIMSEHLQDISKFVALTWPALWFEWVARESLHGQYTQSVFMLLKSIPTGQ